MIGLHDAIDAVLGLNLEPKNLTFCQISLRGVIVFVVALIMVRLGDKRFLSQKTAFDAILAFILGSMLARAINGSVSFFPTLGGGFVLVGLHRAMAYFSRSSHRFGNLVKGRCNLLIKDGVADAATMRRNNISEHDLIEDMRLNGNVDEMEKVKSAHLERDGQISVVMRR